MTSAGPGRGRRAPARAAARMVVGLLAALLPGCDGGSGPDPIPSTPPPAPVTTVVAEGSFSGLEPNGAVVATITTPRAGNIEVVLDWTFASNDLDFLLTRGECAPEQLIALQCTIVAVAESTTAKPERAGVANAPAGPYTLFVGNFGTTEESISFQVLLTTLGTASEPR